MEVAVPLLQHKANPLKISLVLLKMLLHIVKQPPVLRAGTVLADKSTAGENLEYFFGLDHSTFSKGVGNLNEGQGLFLTESQQYGVKDPVFVLEELIVQEG